MAQVDKPSTNEVGHAEAPATASSGVPVSPDAPKVAKEKAATLVVDAEKRLPETATERKIFGEWKGEISQDFKALRVIGLTPEKMKSTVINALKPKIDAIPAEVKSLLGKRKDSQHLRTFITMGKDETGQTRAYYVNVSIAGGDPPQLKVDCPRVDGKDEKAKNDQKDVIESNPLLLDFRAKITADLMKLPAAQRTEDKVNELIKKYWTSTLGDDLKKANHTQNHIITFEIPGGAPYDDSQKAYLDIYIKTDGTTNSKIYYK